MGLINQPAIGKLIRSWRKESKKTQREVAKSIGITIVYMNYIENGKFVPSLDVLERVAAYHNKKLQLSVIG